jgi:hypothetical protein
MDIATIARETQDCSCGYSFLASRLCKLTDKQLHRNLFLNSVQSAVKLILGEDIMPFDDMIKSIEGAATAISSSTKC